MAVTGAFWNLDNPMKPLGIIDPNAVLDILFDLNEWFDGVGDSLARWTIIPQEPITNVGSAADGNVIAAYIAVNNAPPGSTLEVSCRFEGNGIPARADTRSVYLDVVER